MIILVLARIISTLSNPIFILIGLPYFLVIKSTRDPQVALFWTEYTWVFLFVFALFVLIGVKKKFFSDLDVSDRKQRPLLYLVGAMLSALYLYGLFLLQAPAILFITIIGIIIGILIGSIVNMKIKASVHVAAVAALFSALSVVYKGQYLLFLLFIPLICWARVKIKRHTVSEVIVGGIIGSLLSLIMYLTTKAFLNI